MSWYTQSFRRNLVDMHIERDNPAYLSQFDPHAYFACLKKAQVQTPMIYLQSHTGLCNWDTRSGATHPAFAGGKPIHTLIDLCHADGMSVVAYYSLIYNNWAYDEHPEWRMRRSDGTLAREHGRFGHVCPNHIEYRQFLLRQFMEMCSEFTFEGIFLDMTFWPYVCYCDACRARYHKEEGRELPDTVDWTSEAWTSFQRARDRWMGDFAWFCTNALRKMRPDVSVEHQYSAAVKPFYRGVTHINGVASDYCGGDLYGGHAEQSFICKLYSETTQNAPFEYMTSRCDPDLREHTSTKSAESLLQHNCITLAHHGAFLAIDAIDPIGTMNPLIYETLGAVFGQTKAYEPYLTGNLRAGVALYFSFESKMDYVGDRASPGAMSSSHPQLDALTSAARTLQMAHIPYTVIPSSKQTKLKGRQLVIVSDACFLAQDQIDALCAYVENGGALYVSGTTDPRLCNKLLGLVRAGFTKETVTYILPSAAGQAYFGEQFSPQAPIAFPGRQALVNYPSGLQVLATVTLPYTDPADTSVFASIHANPPGVATGYPALVAGRYGRGRVLWSSAALERNQQMTHRAVFLELLRGVLGLQTPIQTDAPEFIEFTLFDDEERRCTFLHAFTVQDMEPLVPARPFNVSLSGGHTIARVVALPDEMPVFHINKEGGISFDVPGFTVFSMYRLDWL